MKTEWPKEVPLLEACDIHRGFLNGPNGTHCLHGWAETVFPEWTHDMQKIVRPVIDRVIQKEAGFTGIVFLNDSERVPKKYVARVWNRIMYRLGYTVGNPERRPLPKVFNRPERRK